MEIRRNNNKKTASGDIVGRTRITTDKFSRRPPHQTTKERKGFKQ